MIFSKYKLSELGNVYSGGTPSTKESSFWDGDIPWITPKDLSNYNGKYISNGERMITELGMNKSSATLIPKGSVLMSSRAPIGYVAICCKDVTTNQGFKSISCDETKCLNEYMYYWIKNNINYITSKSNGSTFKEISGTAFKELEVNVPSINDQAKVLKVLSNIDKKIELNNEINNNLEYLLKKIYKKWFKDYKFSNNKIKFKESELGVIPEKWDVVDLRDVFKFQEGPGIRNWQYVEKNGTKFINIRCIKINDLDISTANMISNEEANGKYSHFMLKEWDLVVSTSGTLGRSQIIREEHLPLCLNTSVIRFFPLNGMNEYSYMYSFLISSEFLNLLDVMATGSAQRNFGPMHLNKIKLIYPDRKTLIRFNKIVFPIIKKIQLNKSENNRLIKLRDTLLPKLMNGQIDLDNIDI